ncbi:MAG: HAMP domain-containing methyl-accepting chemotaxis protein [Deltaproteobacteria bacterium]|nr:HAMP domain-containing methyl-accepting chemotaxis protein [Deltaproteobacteria bacterium]
MNAWTLRTRVTVSVLAVIVVLVIAETAYSVVAYARVADERLRIEAESYARAASGDTILQVAAWAHNAPIVKERLGLAVKGDVVFAAVVDDRGIRSLQVTDSFDAYTARQAASGTAVDRLVTATHAIADLEDKAPDIDDLGLLDAAVTTPPAHKGATATRVVVGIDREPTRARLWRHAAFTMSFGLVAIAVAFVLVRRVFLQVFRRVEDMRDVTEAIAAGDLTRPLEEGTDELGVVSGAVERMRRRWVTIVGEMRAVAESLSMASMQIQRDAADVARGSLLQLRAADDSKHKTEEIVAQSNRVAERVAVVHTASIQSQQALKEAREGTRSVAQRVTDMRRALDENEGHRGALSAAATRIDDALSGLSRAVGDAQRASHDVAQRMAEADATASAIASKAESALSRSGDGLELLAEQRKANDGVVAVTERTRVAASALEGSMIEVLSMAGLISDIADMTSMLSLNASIIAAQAGGQSLGFATVADEIRSLSARTRLASASIADRTADARHQIDVVTMAVQGLSDTVGEARKTSGDTAAVLEAVLASMKGALQDAAGLAALINDAASRTGSVNVAVAQTSAMHKNIENALVKQREAQGRLEDSAQTLRSEADTVAALGAAEDARTDGLLQRAAKILAATDELVAASRAQTELAAAIAVTTTSVRDVAHRHRDTVTAITGSVTELNAQTLALQGAVRSLRVSEPTIEEPPPAATTTETL